VIEVVKERVSGNGSAGGMARMAGRHGERMDELRAPKQTEELREREKRKREETLSSFNFCFSGGVSKQKAIDNLFFSHEVQNLEKLGGFRVKTKNQKIKK
jgi:hypothetical protein